MAPRNRKRIRLPDGRVLIRDRRGWLLEETIRGDMARILTGESSYVCGRYISDKAAIRLMQSK